MTFSPSPPQCPLCRQGITDLDAVDRGALMALTRDGLTGQFVHDMRNQLAPAMNACVVLDLAARHDGGAASIDAAEMREVIQRNLRGASGLLDSLADLLRIARVAQRLEAVSEIENLHRDLEKLLRTECPVNASALRCHSARIDLHGYGPFLRALMQALLTALGRTLEPRIEIGYAFGENVVLGTAKLPPETEIDQTAMPWHLARLLGAMYDGTVHVEAGPDALWVRWSFPTCV